MIIYSMNNKPVVGLVLLPEHIEKLLDGTSIIVKNKKVKDLWGFDVELRLSYFRDAETCEKYMLKGGMVDSKTKVTQ